MCLHYTVAEEVEKHLQLVGKPNRQRLGSGVPRASSNQSPETDVNNSTEYLILKNNKL